MIFKSGVTKSSSLRFLYPHFARPVREIIEEHPQIEPASRRK
jgi:hypothetical protein